MTRPRGANDRREVVGVYSGGHGFLLTQGGFRTIDFPGAVATRPRGINKGRVIVGDYELSDGVVHGFVLTAGGFGTLDFPGACATFPNAINDAGDIVGNYGVGTCDGTEEHHGFVLRNGVYTTIDTLTGSTSS